MLIRNGVYPIEYILSRRLSSDLKKTSDAIVTIDGDMSYMSSQRYEVFDKKGTDCVMCGIKGMYFAKEKHEADGKMWHFNLYAIDENGNEVLMTKDHIIAKSRGGVNNISNYQTMCTYCNAEKGDS